MRCFRPRRVFLYAAICVSLAACDSDGPVPPRLVPDTVPARAAPDTVPARVAAGSNTTRVGAVGGTLADPLVVRVTDANGRALSGHTVHWTVSPGGGTLSDAASATDSVGEASTIWTLPLQPGTHSVSASVAGLPAVQFQSQTVADTVAPALITWSFTPLTVDVSDGAAAVEFTVTAADSGSAVALIIVRLYSPTRVQTEFCSKLDQLGVIPIEVTWSCTITIPQYAEPGLWYINEIVIQDRIRNSSYVSRTRLEQMGLPTALEVRSDAPDVTAPVLTTFSFTPQAVDVTDASATVQFTAVVTDPQSGVRQAQLAIAAPGGSPWADCLQMTRVAGSEAAGTWTCPVTIPQATAPATWTVSRVTLWDHAGNIKSYKTAELRGGGFPVDIPVASASPDTVAPELVAFSVTPETVNVSQGDRSVQFSMTVRDAGQGVARVYAFLFAPGASGGTGCTRTTPVTGDAAEGMYQCSITISQHGVTGDWIIRDIELVDRAGNKRVYQRADLEAAGFRGTVRVTR